MKKAWLFLLFLPFILLASCKQQMLAPTELNEIDKAYQTQQLFIQQLNKNIIGYKAGLTSSAGQAKFGVTEPVAGVLFKDGLSLNRQVYLLEDYQRLMLETEIGFVLNSDIPNFAVFPKDVSGFIEQVVPVIELPDLAYPDMSKVTGLTLIESNVAANQVLIGDGKPLQEIQLNKIQTRLTKNGQMVIQGKATDAMSDQLIALRWLMMRLQSAGYQLKKGDLLITGALGKMIPAERGQYDADFGELGHLSFSIR
ncbi:MAG: 4-oxalocrotonate decarboxylase [Gammaproteobacteria bacterium]|nr:4-oxalocrotonate decarboxylase [Gammaproteobacteria bacterium]